MSNSKRLYRAMFWIMIYCVLTDSIGLFIPIYFTNPNSAIYFYPLVLILILITVCVWSYKTMYLPYKDNWIFSSLISATTTVLALIAFGTVTLVKIWPIESYDSVIYIKKNAQKTKIIRHYTDLGAMGAATKIIQRRELTPFFKIETKIDTNSIDKNEWIRQPIK
jgi:hypothetical protein